VSFALGAFFSGMMMRESEFSHRAAQESLPLHDAFSVLFFGSVGMLFQPQVLVEEPLKVLATVFERGPLLPEPWSAAPTHSPNCLRRLIRLASPGKSCW
jgi:RsiW-degrading membrane proteinase PrsW (M82 family)